MKKKIYLFLCAVAIISMPVKAQTELLENGSFEDYSCGVTGCSFADWSMPLGSGSVQSDDKIDGDVALLMHPNIQAIMDQGVALSDANYEAGTLFTITLNYKVISMPSGSQPAMNCFWEAAAGGDSETIEAHDAEILRKTLETADAWTKIEVTTSKPAKSGFLRIRIKVPKNAKMLFDAFSVVKADVNPGEPFIDVTPNKLSAVETTIGNSATFQTIHISQGNLNGPTTFELSYTDAAMFSLSDASLAAEESEGDLVITYAPTQTGTHTAYLNIINEQHSNLFRSIKLEGRCTDPSAQPVITVTPSELPSFEAVAGEKQTQTITVSSVNCTDYTYLRVDHLQGAAFTIDASMLSKNSTCDVKVRFAPMEEGTYQSTVTIYSTGAESVVVTLNGTATKSSGGEDAWAHDFVWDESNPLALMDEHFDDAKHNKPLQVKGWQNVAAADARPWWGLDESQTSLFDGDGKYAKATAYQFGKTSTGEWEMWLVTPALDYKNAANRVFAFSVMGQYLPEKEIQAALEIYYIDATDPTNVFKQDLTENFPIPATDEEDSQWVTFRMDLSEQTETIADVFHIAFRYVGPNGAEGAVTYYIDDVSWGVGTPEGIETIRDERLLIRGKKILRDGQLLIIREGKTYDALGGFVK